MGHEEEILLMGHEKKVRNTALEASQQQYIAFFVLFFNSAGLPEVFPATALDFIINIC